MLFNSYIFVLLFLPLCLCGYFGLNRVSVLAGKVFLLGMSLWFYGYFNLYYLAIIVASVLGNYGFYLLSLRVKTQKPRRALMVTAIAANLGVLFYFKYFDFFIGNINAVFHLSLPMLKLLLPLGISFFTFQQLSFIIDCFRNSTPPRMTFCIMHCS